MITLSFINETGTPWPQNTICESLDVDYGSGMSTSRGILSEDGMRLSYCLEVRSRELVENSKAKVEAENLLTTTESQTSIQIPLGTLYTEEICKIDCSEYKFDTSNDPYIKLLEEIKKDECEVTIDRNYSSIKLVGAGYLANANESKGESSGLVIYIKNNEYANDTKWWKDAYLQGQITKLRDTRTGEIYDSNGASLFIDEDYGYQVNACHYEDITEEQIPYLEMIEVQYTKQEVVVEGKWQISFEIEQNAEIITWQPELSWEDGEYIFYVDEVHLNTLGIQMKTRSVHQKTGEIKGEIEELIVEFLDKSGNKKAFNNKDGSAMHDEDKALLGYMLTYYYYNEENQREFLDLEQIETIIINGHELQVKDSVQ